LSGEELAAWRALDASDAPAAAALIAGALGPSWDEATVRDELARPGGLCVGEGPDGGPLRGVLLSWVVAAELEINVVVVAEQARRSGLGRRLVEHVLSEARARGAHQAFLEVRASNVGARALYERCGFAETGVRRGYYRDGEDAIVMARTL
jgi:[ribosomal protein S18]-alanine N-acetyltransferase